MSRDSIVTWQQGSFVSDPWYKNVSKADAKKSEKCLVRIGEKGPAICECSTPTDAKWIAKRLNLAAKLEECFCTYHEKVCTVLSDSRESHGRPHEF